MVKKTKRRRLRRISKSNRGNDDGARREKSCRDSNHWIYLTNLKAYNEGFLLGMFLHFLFDEDDLV